MEPGDKVLIPCPKRKRNIRFEGKQNEKLVLRAEVLEASEFSITVRFLDYGAVQEYNPAHTEIYFPDQEFFDDKTYPMFAIRYDKDCSEKKLTIFTPIFYIIKKFDIQQDLLRDFTFAFFVEDHLYP